MKVLRDYLSYKPMSKRRKKVKIWLKIEVEVRVGERRLAHARFDEAQDQKPITRLYSVRDARVACAK
jgi:hypothetical protein